MSNINGPSCLVILAGGKSRRMGQDKATLELGGRRLIDIAVDRFSPQVDNILLSSSGDFGTGLEFIPDDPNFPDGPVGAIYSIAAQLQILEPDATGFVTIPVDAPFAPDDLMVRLQTSGKCTVATDQERMHPVFAYWRCETVHAVRETHDKVKNPSLHWLVRQCDAETVEWPDSGVFTNINTPGDLAAAEGQS